VICPIIHTQSGIVDCFKEECAWWDGVLGTCFVWVLTSYLEAIGYKMGAIRPPSCFKPELDITKEDK